MAVTPLTGPQRAAIDALVQSGRLDRVPVDMTRAPAFLRGAEERIGQLALLTAPAVQYGIAYDACHDVGEALLAAYGLRTSNGVGQHEALGRCVTAIFDGPPGDVAARQFDRLRRARNRGRYEAVPVGAADAAQADRIARELLSAAVSRGLAV